MLQMHAQNVIYNLRSQPGVLEPLRYRKQQRTQADHWGGSSFQQTRGETKAKGEART